MRAFLLVLAVYAVTISAASAQAELSFYGGVQSTHDSTVTGNDPGGIGMFNFIASWKNQLLNPPSKFGMRVTWWRGRNLGWGFDLNHASIGADQTTLTANGLTALEISNGLNQLTVNAYRRWPDAGALRPYVGAGIGIAVPRIEFESGSGRASQIQLTGPAFQLVAGGDGVCF